MTVTYRNVTSRTTVLLRPAIEAPPNTDEQCRHRVAGIPDPVTADTVAVHMDRRTRTEREAGQTAETLGATVIGRSTHEDWDPDSQYLLKFTCHTETDLQDFHEGATAHAGVLNMRYHPENPTGSRISEIEAGPDVTMQQGDSAEPAIRAHLVDGTIRPVPTAEQHKIRLISNDDTIVTHHQNREFQAHRTGRTSVGVWYEGLVDWTSITVLPAPVDDECVLRTKLAVGEDTTVIQAEDLREIGFILQESENQATAAERTGGNAGKDALGQTPGTRCNALMARPQGVDLPERRGAAGPHRRGVANRTSESQGRPQGERRELPHGPRHPYSGRTPSQASPEDLGWISTPPAGLELQGLAVQIIGADRIYPSDRVEFMVGGDYGNNVIATLPQEITDTATVMQLTGTTLLVEPAADGGGLITALRPGNGRLRFEIDGTGRRSE